MTNLLNLMQYESPLGLNDPFRDDEDRTISAEEALRIEFTALCKALDTSDTQTPVFFSADSFDEVDLAYGKPQEDKFAAQIGQAIPNAKICHMRLYATERGAHWHALFAQLDEQGQLKEIVITDSSRGVTSERDKALNPLLFQNADKFRPHQSLGLQQPPGKPICWMYALANLASLATTGKVYRRQRTGHIGEELVERIRQSERKIERAASEASTIASPPSFFSPSISIPIIPLDQSPRIVEQGNSSAIENPIENQNEQRVSSSTVGRNFLLSGIGGIVAGAIIAAIPSPVSLPLGIVLLAIGLIMALAGIGMLIGSCIGCDEPEASPSPSL